MLSLVLDLESERDAATSAEERAQVVKLRRKNWARLIAKVWLENPALCRSCGQEMRIISALTSPHQDAVIERILKCRGQWDPPWKRERRARGPPEELKVVPDDSQLSAEDDEFNQDPPTEWWHFD